MTADIYIFLPFSRGDFLTKAKSFFPCFCYVIKTLVKDWGNSKKLRERSPLVCSSTVFFVLPSFLSCFCSSIRAGHVLRHAYFTQLTTRNTCNRNTCNRNTCNRNPFSLKCFGLAFRQYQFHNVGSASGYIM